MARRSTRWKKNSKGTEVNLIPVLNLIAILIPVMLMQQEYISIAGITVESPIPGLPLPSPEKKLDLTVSITAQGYYLHAGGEYLPNAGGETPNGPTLPLLEATAWTTRDPVTGGENELFTVMEYKGQTYIDGITPVRPEALRQKLDALHERFGSALQSRTIQELNYPGLNALLAGVKQRYPDETTLTLNPQPGITFTRIVRTMDTARERIDAGPSPTQAGMLTGHAPHSTALFPDIRFGQPRGR